MKGVDIEKSNESESRYPYPRRIKREVDTNSGRRRHKQEQAYRTRIKKIREEERRGKGVVMEQLMIKAIREFKKLYPDGEIRSIVVSSWTGGHQKVIEASFEIEYVTQACGEYYKTYIRVEK